MKIVKKWFRKGNVSKRCFSFLVAFLIFSIPVMSILCGFIKAVDNAIEQNQEDLVFYQPLIEKPKDVIDEIIKKNICQSKPISDDIIDEIVNGYHGTGNILISFLKEESYNVDEVLQLVDMRLQKYNVHKQTTDIDKILWNIMVYGYKWSEYVAAGVLANVICECGNSQCFLYGDSIRLQTQYGQKHPCGIFQWTGGRHWNIKRAYGDNPNIHQQMQFMYDELSKYPQLGKQSLISATSAESAAKIFCLNFERCNQSADYRAFVAKKVYQRFSTKK